jgi:hypothetical protein
MRLTPEQEAAYALDYGVSRADLRPRVQAEYDRLLAERRAEATRPRATAPAAIGEQAGRPANSTAAATWQGSPPQPQWRTSWPLWLLAAGGSGVVVAFIVGGFGGSANYAVDVVAGVLFLLAVAAVCVAVPAALYHRFRARRIAAKPPQPPSPFSPCYRCGYPLTVHSGDSLECPEAGVCHRCRQPFTVHVGYELTCPAAAALQPGQA